MKLYEELTQAMAETISATEESSTFKIRFSKLIENFFENSYAEHDINDVINLVDLVEENANGN